MIIKTKIRIVERHSDELKKRFYIDIVEILTKIVLTVCRHRSDIITTV